MLKSHQGLHGRGGRGGAGKGGEKRCKGVLLVKTSVGFDYMMRIRFRQMAVALIVGSVGGAVCADTLNIFFPHYTWMKVSILCD